MDLQYPPAITKAQPGIYQNNVFRRDNTKGLDFDQQASSSPLLHIVPILVERYELFRFVDRKSPFA